MNALAIAIGMGLAAGGAMVAWDQWQAPSGADAQTGPNPIARGLAGELECTLPDRKRRTCRSMAQYVGDAEIGYTSKDSIALGKTPGGDMILKMSTPVRIKDGQLCGTLTRDILMRAQVFVGARALPPEQAAEGLDRMADTMSAMLDKERCGSYVEGADGTITAVGKGELGTMQVPIIWVKPEDGYSVGG
jgi:hypothetical protein